MGIGRDRVQSPIQTRTKNEIEPTICSFKNLKAQYSNLASERKKDSFEFDGIKNMKSAVGGLTGA